MNSEASTTDSVGAIPGSRGRLRRWARGFSWLGTFLGVWAGLSWILGWPILTSLQPDYVPTSPHAAGSLALLGAALLGVLKESRSGHGRRFAVGALALGVVLSLLGLGRISIFPIAAQGVVDGGPEGGPLPELAPHMSPLSAVSLLLVGVGTWILLGHRPGRAAHWSSLLGLLLSAGHFVIVMGYVYGTPLLYGGTVRPVGITTAVGCLSLGLALVFGAGPACFPLNVLTGRSMRARLLRAFLPATLLIVLLNDLLSQLLPGLGRSGALAEAMHALVSLLIMGVLVFFLSRSVGQSLDLAEADRRQAEAALRDSQQRLRLEMERAQQYLDVAGVVLVVLDTAGRVTLLNKRGQSLLGHTEAELAGRDWFETCLPERLRADVRSMFTLLMAGQLDMAEYHENPVLTRFGEERLVAWHNTLLRDAAGQIIGTLSSGEDITARRQAEQALRTAHDELEERVRERTAELEQRNQELRLSEERFRTLFEAAPFAIVLHAPDGRFLQANAAHQVLTGYPYEELQQMTVQQLVHPGHHADLQQSFQAICEGRIEEHHQELRFLTKDGRVRWAAVATAALREAHGQLLCLLSLVEDVTDRKEAGERSVVFARLGQQLSATTTPAEAARIVLDAADALLGWDACYLHLISGRGEIDHVLMLDTVDGRRLEVSPRTFPSLQPSPVMLEVMRSGPRLMNRSEAAEAEDALVPFGDTGRRSASLMFVPIRHGAASIGVLSIQTYTPNAFNPDSLGLLQSLADHCAGALQRIRAAAALQEQERNHRVLLDAIPDALLRVREDGVILDARRGDALSLSVFENAAGRSLRDLIEPPLAEQILSQAARALQTGRPAIFGLMAHRFPSHPAALDIRVVPIGTGEVLVMLRDVTAARRAETALTEAVAQEQRRIGYELHDGLGQHLAGLAVKAKILQEVLQESAAAGSSQAAELVQLANAAIAQTRQLARGLEPVEVEMGDLVPALDRLATESSERFRVGCVLECDLATLPVSSSTGVHLYRIAQEAVRNGIQHGHPRSVVIRLLLQDDALLLGIRDDGRGFNLAEIGQPGLGLQIMQYRASLIGAALSIETKPGEGTEIRCSIPAFQPYKKKAG